jgi:hypothetical protein
MKLRICFLDVCETIYLSTYVERKGYIMKTSFHVGSIVFECLCACNYLLTLVIFVYVCKFVSKALIAFANLFVLVIMFMSTTLCLQLSLCQIAIYFNCMFYNKKLSHH